MLTENSPNIVRYLNVRQAYNPTFASAGDRLAFLTNTTGLPQVWSLSYDPDLRGPTQWPDQLSFHEERVQGVWHSPAPGDGRLVYAMDSGGDELSQLFLLSADGSQERLLTLDRPDAMHNFAGWHPQGAHIAFSANRRRADRFDLYVQDLQTGQIGLVWQNDEPGYCFYGSFSPDGRRLLFSLVRNNVDFELLQLNLATGQVERLAVGAPQREAAPARFDWPAYSPDGQRVFVLSNAGRDRMALARLDLASDRFTYLFTPAWEVEHLAVSPSGRMLALTTNEAGVCRLATLDLATGRVRRAATLPPGVIGLFGNALVFSPDGKLLAFDHSHSTGAINVYLWNLTADRIEAVTRSSHGGLLAESFVEPQLIHYPTFDGLQIPAWYYRPARPDGPLPVAVYVHGGPESQYRPYFNPVVQYLLACGYAVLAPNVRGSTGYGQVYLNLDNVERRMDSVADLAHAAYWLRNQPEVDAERIAVIGASYGGFMVLAALTTYPDLWAAGVDIFGISNFVTFLENTGEYRRSHREAEYGSLERDREFLESISPSNHLDKIRAPLMIVHGVNDPRVPLSESEQIVAALRGRGVPVEFLIFSDEGHGIVKLANKLVLHPKIAQFLRENLGR